MSTSANTDVFMHDQINPKSDIGEFDMNRPINFAKNLLSSNQFHSDDD